MNTTEFKKILLRQSHDNTHSVGRIIRSVEFLKKDDISEERKLKCFEHILNAAKECQNQIDTIYNAYKNNLQS